MARRTLAGTAELSGTGLHTGAHTTVHLSAGEPGAGINFKRTDLRGEPMVAARIGQVQATERRTGLAQGEARVETVEHLLAAAHALQLDDLLISIDGPEPPILDGSFRPWLDALLQAGIGENDGHAGHAAGHPVLHGPGGRFGLHGCARARAADHDDHRVEPSGDRAAIGVLRRQRGGLRPRDRPGKDLWFHARGRWSQAARTAAGCHARDGRRAVGHRSGQRQAALAR